MSWRAQISKNLSELRIVFDPKAAGSAGTQYVYDVLYGLLFMSL